MRDKPATLIGIDLDRWLYHPNDTLVDVAIVPWAPPSDVVDYISISIKMLATDDVISGASDTTDGTFNIIQDCKIIATTADVISGWDPVGTSDGNYRFIHCEFEIDQNNIATAAATVVARDLDRAGAHVVYSLWNVALPERGDSAGAQPAGHPPRTDLDA